MFPFETSPKKGTLRRRHTHISRTGLDFLEGAASRQAQRSAAHVGGGGSAASFSLPRVSGEAAPVSFVALGNHNLAGLIGRE